MTDASRWPDWMRYCAHCGAQTWDGISRPMASTRDENDELVLFSFCDSACLSAWEETGRRADDQRGP